MQVDPVAEKVQAGAGDAEPGQGLEVLGVLDQLGVRAGRRHSLQPVHGRPAEPPIRFGGVRPWTVLTTAVHLGRPRREPAVHAGFGIVGVDDVGPQPPEQAVQPAGGTDVAGQGETTGGVRERDMAHTRGDELWDVWSGCRYADNVVAGVGEGAELRSQQEGQADIGRGEVDQPGTGSRGLAGVAPASDQPAHLVLQSHTASDLGVEVAQTVPDLHRRAGQLVGIGAAIEVAAGTSQGGRDEPDRTASVLAPTPAAPWGRRNGGR